MASSQRYRLLRHFSCQVPSRVEAAMGQQLTVEGGFLDGCRSAASCICERDFRDGRSRDFCSGSVLESADSAPYREPLSTQ